jgi:multifunctional beta-oxidation protein
VKKAKQEKHEPVKHTYTERDVALYNIGIGATEKELKFTFEGDENFQAIPTFGVVPQFASSAGMPLDWLPNFSPNMLLHGEQYLSIKAPIPTSATLVSESKLLEALDKGKAAAITSITQTKDKATGEVIFESQSTVFIRGSGGFGGKKTGKDRGPATAANKPPSRPADKVIEEKTDERQAALYRLGSLDMNPLHISPQFAAVGGFKKPILHGLCSYGIAGKNIYKEYGAFKDIKARFSGVVIPGETLVVSMWKEGKKVIFDVKVKETGKYCLQAAAVTLV